MKKILGLDLGTNSIGWALISQDEKNCTGEIIKVGSRIIPMSEDILGKFDSGITESDTAKRTAFRGVRRLRERNLLRRERLHRILNIIGFLPEHYAREIDFEHRLGQYLKETEPKIAYRLNDETKKFEFIFKKSFSEMVEDFKIHQPQLLEDGRKVPYDWTIYFLRNKALTEKIEKEELAWLLLNFNQKRGYYQLRGEDDDVKEDKITEILNLKIEKVIKEEKYKNTKLFWYKIILEGGYEYKRTSENGFDNWINTNKDFIITKELNEDGSLKYTKDKKESKLKISVELLPTIDEIEAITDAKKKGKLYKKIKIRTENTIENSGKTVGAYIYNTLLTNPKQKINGQLVRVVERKFYREELTKILQTQLQFHDELKDLKLYEECIEELYENNDAHRNSISQKDFAHLFINDIIFYQRPLKSKKSLISDCKYERRTYIKDGVKVTEPIKCIAKSHPLFQEFRLWQWLQNLRIYEKETDQEVTNQYLNTEEDWANLFEWLNDRKEVDHKALLNYLLKPLKLKVGNYRWNYVYDAVKDESKKYPCNKTRNAIINKLGEKKCKSFLTQENEIKIWELLYSIDTKEATEQALSANEKRDVKKQKPEQYSVYTLLVENGFTDVEINELKRARLEEKDYGSYSTKAIKKLLPLMRIGKYWNADAIHNQTYERIGKIINAEYDDSIRDRVRDKAINLKEISDFKGLPLWLTSYIVYDRHSEDGDIKKWKTPQELEAYIKEFKQHSLRNPIVEQVITETLRVVKDIWTIYGAGTENFFDEIHVELGREMKNPKSDREKITQQNTINENTNLRIKALLAELVYPEYNVKDVRAFSPYQQEILRIYEDGVLNSENEIPDDIIDIQKKFRENDLKKQPSKSDFMRYKLWLDQGYISPYTGEIIPLNRLFTTDYQIEHIIPQSRFFDDSFSNKVICESVVNGEQYKRNRTGLEFIKEFKGKVVTELTTTNHIVKIFTEEQYESHVKKYFSKSRSKMQKLLMEDIPEKMIERQMNDTRYISKVVKNLLSNIVREDKNDEGTTSNNVLSSNGQITTALKQDWGLNDVWNEIIAPRFERLNKMTNSTNFGSINEKTNKFLPTVPLELSKGFSKKRIDHRHHAMDALAIACATRNHINYLNNQNALEKGKSKEQKQKKREDLRSILCFKKYNEGSESNYKWMFKKPWDTYTQDAKSILEITVVSFKQNLRVINKTTNRYQRWEVNNGIKEKIISTQTNGDSWAVRKPLHKDTVSGLVRLRFKKIVMLSVALENWEDIVDNEFRKHIKGLVDVGYDKKMLQKYFKDRKNILKDKDVSKVEVYYWDKENVASRVKLDESFNASKIDSITDTGIKTILLNHLNSVKYQDVKDEKGKIIAPETLAFSADGIDEMNKNMVALNGGKNHQPIIKVRTYTSKGNKFIIGETGNKKDKYVVAADGTNLFFAIYKSENGERKFDAIPLNIVIKNQKAGALNKLNPENSSVFETNESGNNLCFYLSPNDLVYIPTEEELENSNLVNLKSLNSKQIKQIYRFIDGSGTTANFIPNYSACTIFNLNKKEQTIRNLNYSIQNEYGVGSPQSKNQKSLEGIMIKDCCWKLQVNRVGEIVKIIK